MIDPRKNFNDGAARSASAARCIFWSGRRGSRRLSKSLGWRFGRTISGERFPAGDAATSVEKYLAMYICSQQSRETNADAVATSAASTCCRASCGLDPTNDGVRFDFSPTGDYRLAASACRRGARSPIRSMLGLRMKGDIRGRYVIADIACHDFPTSERLFRTGRKSRRHGADSQAARTIRRLD